MTNKIYKHIIIFFLLLSVLTFSVKVNSEEVLDTALEQISKSLILKDYKTAYSLSLFSIKSYGPDTIPTGLNDAIKNSVVAYATELYEKKDWHGLIAMKKEIAIAPKEIKTLPAFAIEEAEKQLNLIAKKEKERQQEVIRIAQTNREMIERQKQSELEYARKQAEWERELRILEQQKRAAEESNQTAQLALELEKQARAEEKQFRDLTEKRNADFQKEIIQTIKQNNEKMIKSIVVFGFVMILVILIVMLLIIRRQKRQSEQLYKAFTYLSQNQLPAGENIRVIKDNTENN